MSQTYSLKDFDWPHNIFNKILIQLFTTVGHCTYRVDTILFVMFQKWKLFIRLLNGRTAEIENWNSCQDVWQFYCCWDELFPGKREVASGWRSYWISSSLCTCCKRNESAAEERGTFGLGPLLWRQSVTKEKHDWDQQLLIRLIDYWHHSQIV